MMCDHPVEADCHAESHGTVKGEHRDELEHPDRAMPQQRPEPPADANVAILIAFEQTRLDQLTEYPVRGRPVTEHGDQAQPLNDTQKCPRIPSVSIVRLSSGAGRRIKTSAGTWRSSHSRSSGVRPRSGLSVAETITRSNCS